MHKLQRLYWKLFRNVFVSSTSEFVATKEQIEGCRIKVSSASHLVVGNGSRLVNCTIDLTEGSCLEIGEHVELCNMQISVHHAKCIIGDKCNLSNAQIYISKDGYLSLGTACVMEQGDNWRGIIWRIDKGSSVIIADHNRFRCDLEIRFGGICTIGRYNCLNEGTEIRADESVVIGDYNMISYHCRIWDTDTHTFYTDDTRRRLTEKLFPNVGAEKDKPITKSVQIGSDNLIGERAAVLKGSRIGDFCKVGFNVVVANKVIKNHTTYVGK